MAIDMMALIFSGVAIVLSLLSLMKETPKVYIERKAMDKLSEIKLQVLRKKLLLARINDCNQSTILDKDTFAEIKREHIQEDIIKMESVIDLLEILINEEVD